MASFGDLSTPAGLKALNEHLATKSYIEGYVPCQADVTTFAALAAPDAQYCHAARWYRHIKSFSAEEQKSFPGVPEKSSVAAPAAAADDDDDFDIFGDDDDEEEEETEEEKKIREERLAAYHAKKEKKPALIAKSSLVLDVKPWDDETDMPKMEECVRSIKCDGLVWGQSKFVPLAYGIKKLQICAVIEDDKVMTDWLDEEICKFDELVQSMDIAKFNKI
jgi:elongation factor 1-beta